jgi:hypothetical protein
VGEDHFTLTKPAIFILTKRDMQMNMKISDFIADPTLVSRAMITGIASDEELLERDIVHYLGPFSGLEEVDIADQGYPEYKNYHRLCTVSSIV